MIKWSITIILFLVHSNEVFSDGSEVLKLNISNESTSTTNLTFYLVGLGILLIGVISSEIFKFGSVSKILNGCRVDKLFIKAKIENNSVNFDVYVRALDQVSMDFVSQKKFAKRDIINFKLLSLKGLSEFYSSEDVSDDHLCIIPGEVVFSKKLDKNSCPTFLTRIRFSVVTEQAQKPLTRYLQKLRSRP